MAPPNDVLDFSAIAQSWAWDDVSIGYADALQEPFAHYADHALDLAKVRTPDRVIDVATGPGTLALRAASSTRVTAVDFSSGMLSVLRQRAGPALLGNLTLVEADGQALPFPDASFDKAFSMFGLFLFADRARGFAELARVLRPGGIAVVSSWQPRPDNGVLRVIGEVLWGASAGAAQQEPPAGGPLSDPEDLRSEMGAAGFDVTLHSVDHALNTLNLHALWQSMQQAHVGLGIARKQLTAAGYERLCSRIERRLRDELHDGPQTLHMPAWLAHGVKRVRPAL